MKRYQLYYNESSIIPYYFYHVSSKIRYTAGTSVVSAYSNIGVTFNRHLSGNYELIAECDSLSDLEDSHPEFFI